MNELVRNQCDVTNHQVNVQFLLQLQQEWQRFVTLVKQSQELKTVSYHKLYDILKQHQNEVNEIRAERLARTANPLALVAQEQPVYHPQNHPNHYTDHNKLLLETEEKEINKLMDLISLSFKKIYKPTNNNLRTSSNTSRANQDNTPRINRGTGYDNQRAVNVSEARENVGNVRNQNGQRMYLITRRRCYCVSKRKLDFELNTEQGDWRDDTNDEPEDQELEAHYLYMAQIQEVTLDAIENSRPVFDVEQVQNDDDNYNLFANDREHTEQPESINDTYPDEQGDTNITTDSLDMSNNRGEAKQDEDEDLARECDLLASLIEKLKCETDESKDRNKLLESSNKNLVDKLKSEIEDFKNKNKCLESSNNHFKEANTEVEKNNQLMFKDLKKFQFELDTYHDVNYASKVEIDGAKAKGDLMSYKMESQKSFNEYTRKVNDLNQTILESKKELKKPSP
ncbi:hypothetical protein Tco_1451580 [Tanacetum coccineum]